MEHLGGHVSTIQGFGVPLVTDLDGSHYKSATFHKFPGANGWDLNQPDGGQPVPVNANVSRFDERDKQWRISRFAQRYLFFEVLRAIFEPNGPFSYFDFVSRDRNLVTTAELPRYLQRWEHFERKEKDRSMRLSRLVRAQLVLDTARHYVSNHCTISQESEWSHKTLEGLYSHWPVDPVISLSFMVLGETLSRSLIKIQHATDCRVRGWQDHELTGQGWGYSKKVVEELLQRRGWCPKTIRMLSGLFKGNTIGLLYAIPFANDSGRYHYDCTSVVCKAPLISSLADVTNQEPVNDRRAYKTQHVRGHLCSNHRHPRTPCISKGPSPSKIAGILDRGNIPLFVYDRVTCEITVSEMVNWNEEYAIFSHVWADGFGNPYKNEINQCVLELFNQLFENIWVQLASNLNTTATPPMGRIPNKFWIDTLAIPVGDEYGEQRKVAIEKMHDVYSHASYTIVLDAGLMEREIGHDLMAAAMMITMCSWMTRLWTLQEAYLSKRLYFNFSDKLCSLEQLEDRLSIADQAIHDPVPSIALTFYHSFLGVEREKRKFERTRVRKLKTSALFVAEVWKAVQWRTTNHLQHETLALATLFNIDTNPFSDSTNTAKSETNESLDKRMTKLLELLSELEECAIPSGLIFLPGPRLNNKGYRWAPRSWLSAKNFHSHDPITHSFSNSKLVQRHGLEVTYPGFLVHRTDPDGYHIARRNGFQFPTHLRLAEWYHVTKADADDSFPQDRVLNFRSLAIIATSLPAAHSKVIALLVAINRSHSSQYDVEILNRIWLHREGDQEVMKCHTTAFKNDNLNAMFFGEALPENQIWCVDGPDRPDLHRQADRAPPTRSAGATVGQNVVRAAANIIFASRALGRGST